MKTDANVGYENPNSLKRVNLSETLKTLNAQSRAARKREATMENTNRALFQDRMIALKAFMTRANERRLDREIRSNNVNVYDEYVYIQTEAALMQLELTFAIADSLAEMSNERDQH